METAAEPDLDGGASVPRPGWAEPCPTQCPAAMDARLFHCTGNRLKHSRATSCTGSPHQKKTRPSSTPRAARAACSSPRHASSPNKRQAAAGHPRPSDGKGAGGEGLAAEYSGDPSRELSIHGVEKTDETGRFCRLVAVCKDLAVHGVELRESLSSDAQVFDEHGKRFVVSPVGAVASGDAQWLRSR